MKYLILILCLVACKPVGQKDPKADERVEQLQVKYLELLADAVATFDQHWQWPSVSDCDAALWAGLAVAGGIENNLSTGVDKDLKFHRTPNWDCYANQLWNESHESKREPSSKSTISRDMLIGYLWGIWESKDLELALKMAKYGESHQWIMGDGDPFRIEMGGNLRTILGQIIYRLSDGEIDRRYRDGGVSFVYADKDYEQHIMVLTMLLYGEVKGRADTNIVALLQVYSDKYPNDALFDYAEGRFTGDLSKGLGLILNDDYQYPSYVRGHENYKKAHRLFVMKRILNAHGVGVN